MILTILGLVIFGVPILMMLPRGVRWCVAILSLTTGWFAVLIIIEVIIADIAAEGMKS